MLTWTQAAQTVYGLLQYTDKKDQFNLADVMGLSGHAFRITIDRETVSPAGPTVYSPFDLMGRPLGLFGCKVKQIFFPVPATPEQLEQFVAFVQESVDRGMPVTGWDIFIPEFGIIYGYDHEKQLLYVRDVEKDGTIAYSELNNRRYNVLHSMTITESEPVQFMPVLIESLKQSIAFYRGKLQKPEHEPFRNGLEAYEAWMEAFAGKHINIVGNAYNLAVVADAREFAVKFFGGFRQKWPGETSLERDIVALADEAAAHFEQAASALGAMRAMFPFPHGGEPNDPNEADAAIRLLKQTKTAEEQAVSVMERMLDRLLLNEP